MPLVQCMQQDETNNISIGFVLVLNRASRFNRHVILQNLDSAIMHIPIIGIIKPTNYCTYAT